MATLIKVDSNENPFGPSPSALKAMQAVLAGCSEYPDDDAYTLRCKLAEYHGVQVEQILVTGGLTEFLGMLARTFLAPDLNAVTSQRSFIVYRMATEAAGADLIEVRMRENGFDLDGIAAAVNNNTRIIFLANPNNPTGSLVTADDVDHLLSLVPEPHSRTGRGLLRIRRAFRDHARRQIFALPRLRARRTQCGGVANVFQSTRTGRSAGGLRDCIR